MESTDKTRENRLRRQLRKHGIRLKKSRIRNPNIDNYGHYMLIDIYKNLVIEGSRYDMTLDDIEDYVKNL